MADPQERRATALRHLRTLELKPGAQLTDVKSARLTLVKVWHPDRWEHDPGLHAKGEARLKQVDTAYSWLCQHAAVLDGLSAQRGAPRREAPPASPVVHPRSRFRMPGWIERVPTSLSAALGCAMLVGILWAILDVSHEAAQEVHRAGTDPGTVGRGRVSGTEQGGGQAQGEPPDLDSTAVHPVVVQGRLYVVRASQLNVRKSPSDESAVVGHLSRGDPVLAVSFSKGWRHIVEPLHGWVHGAYLARFD